MGNISEVMNILGRHFDVSRRTTLNRMRGSGEPDAFKILIGCLVSINIKDEVCEKILDELFSKAGSFDELLEIDDDKLEGILYLARYRRVKAARLKQVSREVLERFEGEVPSNKEDLLSIKGIGPKTCNVVLSFAFGKPVIPVDSNTIRIANRLGWIDSEKADEVEMLLVEKLDEDDLRGANAIFMLHGKNICTPISPFCSSCPVEGVCMKIGVEKTR